MFLAILLQQCAGCGGDQNDKLDDTPEQLLARAYALHGNDPDETRKLYSDWAETYDQTMLGGCHVSPRRIATLAAMTEARRNARILDWLRNWPARTLFAWRRVLIGSTVWTTPFPC